MNKKVLIVLIILFLLVAFAGGIVYFKTAQDNRQNSSNEMKTENLVKTCQVEMIGREITIPQSWDCTERKESSSTDNGQLTLKSDYYKITFTKQIDFVGEGDKCESNGFLKGSHVEEEFLNSDFVRLVKFGCNNQFEKVFGYASPNISENLKVEIFYDNLDKQNPSEQNMNILKAVFDSIKL